MPYLLYITNKYASIVQNWNYFCGKETGGTESSTTYCADCTVQYMYSV